MMGLSLSRMMAVLTKEFTQLVRENFQLTPRGIAAREAPGDVGAARVRAG